MTSILVVCTGNICRSPVAEGFLRGSFATRFGDGAPTVSSAGIAGLEGSPASEESVLAASEYGTDIRDHRGRMLTRAMVDADLILGMASEHRETVIDLDPSASGRTFTLKELARLLEELEPVEAPALPGSLPDRLAQAQQLRLQGFRGNPLDESVVDPIGLGMTTYRAVAWDLQEWTRRLVTGLFGPEPLSSQPEERTRGAVG
jgi:protein-tyrosine phosphatase